MSGPRLLVIDDSPTIRKLVELSFNNSEWTVEFAASGAAGLECVSRRVPEVILLDFVLPDMRGTEVCERLANDPRARDVAIIVMSAKHESVRSLFDNHASVLDFIGKPFAATDIVARVSKLQRRARTQTSVSASEQAVAFEIKQAAAQAIYSKLRPGLALIPELMTELRGASPAAFFARKLLTPQVIDELFEALLPVMERSSETPEPRTKSGLFQGTLGCMSLPELLKLLGDGQKSGELRLRFSEQTICAYLRAGMLIFVSCDNGERYIGTDLGFNVAEDVLKRALQAQRTSSKPALLTLAEAGALSSAELPRLIDEYGRRLLVQACDEQCLDFSFHPDIALPSYVEAFAANITLSDLELARLRIHPRPNQAVRLAAGTLAVFERTENFSKKLRNFALTEVERLVLAAVDGVRTLREIAISVELESSEVTEIVERLTHVALLSLRDVREHDERSAKVLVSDPDNEDFIKPLSRLFAEWQLDLQVLDTDLNERIVDTIMRENPRLVIVNASAAGSAALRLAEKVRADSSLTELRMVAVLDTPASEQAGRLASAGYDAVFTKPIRHSDLERLLQAEGF